MNKFIKNNQLLVLILCFILLLSLSLFFLRKPVLPSPECNLTEPEYYYDSFGYLIKIDYGDPCEYGLLSENYFYNNSELEKEIYVLKINNNNYFYSIEYKYNSNNSLSYYKSPFEEIRYEYDDENRLIEEDYNGEITTYDYDNESRVVCINCQPEASGIPEIYEYDSNGSVVYMNIAGKEYNQEFDEQGRLTKKQDYTGGYADFEYDDNGSLLSIDDTGYFNESYSFSECGYADFEYDEECNLIKDDTYFYEYNEFGNVVNKTILNETGQLTNLVIYYAYNDDFQIVNITYPDNSVIEYVYDSSGLYKLSDEYSDYYLSPIDYSTLYTESGILGILEYCGEDCGEIQIDWRCDDGIQNGYEEGIDCGLSCWNTCKSEYCGNQSCDETIGESCSSCPEDCGTCPSGVPGTGGGGGASSRTEDGVIVYSLPDLTEYTELLSEGDIIEFSLNLEQHKLEVKEITNSEITIEVSSETQTATLSVNQDKDFDLNSDNIQDINIKVNSIEESKAGITLKKYSVPLFFPQLPVFQIIF
jgi:YD repeat-containing protein